MADIDISRLAYFNGRPGNGLHASEITPLAEASFWSLVDLKLPRSCWIWTGQRGGLYGRFKIGSRRFQAHRFAYASAWGYCPAHLVVRHTCDIPLCVAPHHLVLGTDTENMSDKVTRGRHAYGETIGGAILTEDQVREIRKDKRAARIIGEEFGVGKSTVQKIKMGLLWKHIL